MAESSLTVPLSAPAAAPALGTGDIAALLATALAEGDVMFAATDEQRAHAISRALAAAAPRAQVVFGPGSAALPGDAPPASPANVGQRVSALRAIRLALAQADHPPIACVTTGEALARLYPPPAAFDTSPPRVAVGDAVELAQLFERLQELGYVVDERVDEPGEVALRGQVLDIYPADADVPLRIEAVDGAIVAIRLYDPASQLTTGECDARELGRVAEPLLDGKGVTLLDHLPDARLVMPASADDRRRRFLALARDAERRRPKRAVRDVASDAAWKNAVEASARNEYDVKGEPPLHLVNCYPPHKVDEREAT